MEQRARGNGRLSDLGDDRERHLRPLLAGRGLAIMIMERRGLSGGRLSDLGDARVRYLRLLLTGRSMAIMDRCGLGGVGLMVRRLELLLPGCALGMMERCDLAGGRVCDLGEGRPRPRGLGLVALVECGRNLLLVDGKTETAVNGTVGVHG